MFKLCDPPAARVASSIQSMLPVDGRERALEPVSNVNTMSPMVNLLHVSLVNAEGGKMAVQLLESSMFPLLERSIPKLDSKSWFCTNHPTNEGHP